MLTIDVVDDEGVVDHGVEDGLQPESLLGLHHALPCVRLLGWSHSSYHG